MEEKEASPNSNSTSPLSKKTIVLGVVNASEIKCKVDRKRRWDQPPVNNENEAEGPPPSKQLCDVTVNEFVEDSLLENNVRHDDILENDFVEEIPLPPGVESTNDRLTSPISLSEPVVIKEQIIVQTPSDVLNSLDINSSFPISSSFNDLNYTEGNRRVTIEIETVEVTPSSCDDEPKSSIQVIDPNSATVDSCYQSNDNSIKIGELNCNDDSSAPSPAVSEGGEVIGRALINVDSAGNIDPEVMEVILGISSTKESPKPSQKPIVNTPLEIDKVEEEVDKNLIPVEQNIKLVHNTFMNEVDTQLSSDKSKSIKESGVTKAIGMKLKGLVDYDDDSDESSQLSDKIITTESIIKKSSDDISPVCENSVDSKEEEFHDCFEQQPTDESNYDSASLNNAHAVSALDSDDLINNNPLESNNINCENTEDLDSKKSKESCSITTDNTILHTGDQGEISLLMETQRNPELLQDKEICKNSNQSIDNKEGNLLNAENSNDIVTSGTSHIENSPKNVSSVLESDLNPDENNDTLECNKSSFQKVSNNSENDSSDSILLRSLNDAISKTNETNFKKSNEFGEDKDDVEHTRQDFDSVINLTEIIGTSDVLKEVEDDIINNELNETEDKSELMSSQIPNSVDVSDNADVDTSTLVSSSGMDSLPSNDNKKQEETKSQLLSISKDVNEIVENIEHVQNSVLPSNLETKATSDTELMIVQTPSGNNSVSSKERHHEKLFESKEKVLNISITEKTTERVEVNDLKSVKDSLDSFKCDEGFSKPEQSKEILSLNVEVTNNEKSLTVEKSSDISIKTSSDYLDAENDAKNDTSKFYISTLNNEKKIEDSKGTSDEKTSEIDLVKLSDIKIQRDNNLDLDLCERKESVLDNRDTSVSAPKSDEISNTTKCNEIKEVPTLTPTDIEEKPCSSDNLVDSEKNETEKSLESVEKLTVTPDEKIEEKQEELVITSSTNLPSEKIDSSKQLQSKDQEPSENELVKTVSKQLENEKLIDITIVPEKTISTGIIKSLDGRSDLKGDETDNPLNKSLSKDFLLSPQLLAYEKSETSLQSSADLNMECESVDTEQSIESTNESLPTAVKNDPQLEVLNPNAVIDISSDSTSSDKKEKAALSFNLSSSVNKKANEKSEKNIGDKFCKIISSDDDVTSNKYKNSSEKRTTDFKDEKYKDSFANKIKVDSNIKESNINSDIILVPDSDSSCSRGETISKVELSNKVRDPSNVSLTSSNDLVITNSQFSPSNNYPQTHVTKSITNDSLEICDNSIEMIRKNEDSMGLFGSENVEDLNKGEPITLRIFKDTHSLHSESGAGSPKRPRLDDSPKQLEFTLKISKDASTNIPKATMSPKRTQSPQRLPDPMPRISSEVSIIPLSFPSSTDNKTGIKVMRHLKQSHSEVFDIDESISTDELPKQISTNSDVRVPNVDSIINNIPCDKQDLSKFNSVRENDSREENSIIGIKIASPEETRVNISIRGSRRGRGNIPPGSMPRRRGRPPKRPVEDILLHASLEDHFMAGSYPSDFNSSDASGRPVRECRDRTRPIVFRQRRPRGGGNSMSRGRGGRGRGRLLHTPGIESLSLREQEELARIEARNQLIRLEKLAKREAKLAKKAKRGLSPDPPSPLPPPIELTEEERAALAIRLEAEARARAEAAALAAIEAERLAKEAAAAKEAEKLRKLIARKEKLREIHRMKREKMLAKKAAKKLKDEERRKRKQAEKAAEQAAALQNMYEDETRMSAPDGSLRPIYGEEGSNRNKTGRMEINLSESKEVSVEQLAEYQWEGGELYMIQEQVAEYLGVKSFKRKYPDLRRRPVDAEERKYLEETGLVPKSLCDLGITAVSSAEVLDIMFQDFPEKYEEVRKYLREKQMREISSKQKALSLYSKQSDKAKADLRDQAMECVASWNSQLNKERREERKCSMDLQSFMIHYPLSKRDSMKVPTSAPGNYPVAVLPGQFCDFYKSYTSNELMYYPLNTVLYGPLKPNERHVEHSDASLSDTESSSSEESSSSSGESDSESEGDEDTKCKVCNSSQSSGLPELGSLPSPSNGPEIFLPCTKCKLLSHPSCCKITIAMLPHVRKYNWLCRTCKICVKCNSSENQDKMRLCDLCDRGFHIACLDARKLVPEGKRWHCAICSFCWSCGIREPGGPSNQWLHEFIKDENGEKVYQRSLCAACCANVGREAAAAVAATAAAARAANSANAGTSMAGTSGIIASCSNANSPVRGYQLIQTKDGNQVRVAMSRGMGPMVVRSPGVMGGPRGSTPETLVVRSPRGTETVVVRNPMSIQRPRQNIILSPNNRIEMVSHLSTNINGASNNAKK